MSGYRASIFVMSCVIMSGLHSNAWSNPNQINSGDWALHIPFDLEPTEALGARALGMGNAFVGIADDATAAVVNPAGLAQIVGIDFTANYRYSFYEKEYLDTYAAVNNVGIGPELEEIRVFDNDMSRFSFVGLTIPVIPGQLVTSLYYKNTSFEAADTQSAGPVTVLGNVQQQNISTKNIDTYQKDVYGVAAALNYSKSFSIGAAINMETLDTDLSEEWSTTNFIDYDFDSMDSYDSQIQGDDSDVTFNIGVLIKPVDRLSIGVSYRTGSSFSIGYTSTETTCEPFSACNQTQVNDYVSFDVPDILSSGVAWETFGGWRFSVQMDIVEYSVLQDSTTEDITMDETIEDGIIYRFGVEKSFYESSALLYQLRAGMFTVPDHDGFQAIDSDSVYYTFGGGVTLSEQFKLNVGISFSEDMVDNMLSLSYTF